MQRKWIGMIISPSQEPYLGAAFTSDNNAGTVARRSENLIVTKAMTSSLRPSGGSGGTALRRSPTGLAGRGGGVVGLAEHAGGGAPRGGREHARSGVGALWRQAKSVTVAALGGLAREPSRGGGGVGVGGTELVCTGRALLGFQHRAGFLSVNDICSFW